MDKIGENMNQLGTGIKKGWTENYYRFLTVANLALNKVARPITDGAFNFIENNITVEEEKVDTNMGESIKKTLKQGVIKSHQLFVTPLDYLGGVLRTSENELAETLKKEYGIDTNQWVFSRENLEMLEKINLLADATFQEVRHISNFKSMRYLTAWTIIQKLDRKVRGRQAELEKAQADELRDGLNVATLKIAQAELMYYALFAHGTYGDVMNYVYSGRNYNKLLAFVDYTKEFIAYTKILAEDLLYSFWDATPYRPAYCIAHNRYRREIVLCMRGSNNWADFATDLDFHYLKFKIMKENDTKEMYLKFEFDEHTQLVYKDRIGENTKYFNFQEGNEAFNHPENTLESGFAHAGMLVSAISAFKEITPKLEEIFSRPEYEDFDLVIAGHSLGGGMATLMAFLYLVHPLKAMKGDPKDKIRAYSYGGASVLSKDFDLYLKHVVTSVVFGNDIVPRLSYGSIKDLCKIILTFEQVDLEEPQFLKNILNLDIGEEFNDIKDEDIAQVQRELDLYQKIKRELMDSVKLYQMGNTYYLEPVRKPKKNEATKGGDADADKQKASQDYDFMICEIKNKDFFEEIIFSRELVKHHFPHLYEEGLQSEKVHYKIR